MQNLLNLINQAIKTTEGYQNLKNYLSIQSHSMQQDISQIQRFQDQNNQPELRPIIIPLEQISDINQRKKAIRQNYKTNKYLHFIELHQYLLPSNRSQLEQKSSGTEEKKDNTIPYAGSSAGRLSWRRISHIIDKVYHNEQSFFKVGLITGEQIHVRKQQLQAFCPQMVIQFYKERYSPFDQLTQSTQAEE